MDFERALQDADKRLGNDGKIGVPYWDFADIDREGPMIPKMIREMEFPRDAMIADPNGDAARLYNRGYSRIRSDEEIRDRFRSAEIQQKVDECLKQTEHWKFASTRWGGGTSVESPHNIAHTVVGYPLSSVKFAAFSPIFYLIHANADRILDKYLQIETDSEMEFKQYQKRLHEEEGERNRFEEPLRPFMNPITKEEFRVVDTFDSEALGYKYDKHPTLKPPQMRSQPIVAAFRGIDITPLRGRSVELHVFVFEKGRMSTHHFHPGKDHREWGKNPNYGGLGCVFGGKGTDCVNCKESKPINVFVDIGQRLAKMSLTQHEVELRVWTYVCIFIFSTF